MASKRRRLDQAGGNTFQPPTDEFDRIPPPVRYNQQFATASPPPDLYNRQFAAASPLPDSEPGDMEDGEELPLDPSEMGNSEEAPLEAGYWQEDGNEALEEPGVVDEEAPALSGYWDPLAERGDGDEEAPAEPGEWEDGEVAPVEPNDIGDDEQAAAELGYWVGGEEVPAESGDYNDDIPAETADWKDDEETPGDIAMWEDGGEALPESGGWEGDEEDVSVLLEPLTKKQLIDLLRYAAASDLGTLTEIRNIADRDPANRNIFVHSLSLCTTGDSLAAAFASYGEIESCRVVRDKNTGRSKGYGFVLFRHRVSARRALSQPQRFIDNQMAVCQLASAGPSQISPNNPCPDKMGRKIFVGNLPWGVDAHQLWDFFAQYGKIEEGPLGFDRRTGKCRGYTLFVYQTVEEAQKAIEVPQKMYEGRWIYCRMAQSKSKNSPGYTNANDPPNAQSRKGGYNQPGNHGPPPGYRGSAYGGDGPPGFSDSGYGGDQHPGCDGGYDESVYDGTQSGFKGSGYGGPPPGFKGSWYDGPPHMGSGNGGAPPGFNASGYGGAPPNESGSNGPPPGYNSSGYGPPHKGPGHGVAPPGFNASGYGGTQPNESGYDGPPPGYNSSGEGGPPPGFNGSGHAGAPLGFNGSGHGCPPPDMMQAVQQTPMMATEMLRMGVHPPPPDMMQAVQQTPMMATEMLRMGVHPPSQALPPNAMAVGAMLVGARQNLTASGFTPNMLASVNPAFDAVLGPGGMQGMPPSAVPPTGPVQVYGMMNAGYQNAGFQGPPGFSNGGGGSYQCGEVGSYQGGGGGLYQGEGGGSFQVGGGGLYQGEGGGSFQDGRGGSYQGEGGGSFQGGGGGSHQGGWGGSFQDGGGGLYQGEGGGSFQGGWGGSHQGGGGGSFQGGGGGAYQDGPMGHGHMANPPVGPMGGSQEGSRKRHHSPL